MKTPNLNDQFFTVSNTGAINGPFSVTLVMDKTFRLNNGFNYDVETGKKYGIHGSVISWETAQEFSQELVLKAQLQQVKNSVIDAKNNLVSILHSVTFDDTNLTELLEATDKIGEFSEFLSSNYMKGK